MGKPKHTARERTAYHEAGHAVMAFYLHRRIVTVTIVADEEQGSLGHVRYGQLPPTFDPDVDTSIKTERLIQREVLLCVAGNTAEWLLTGRNNWTGASDDRHKAVQIAGYLCGSNEEIGAYISWLMLRAASILHRPDLWAGVEGLAKALLERDTIGSREIPTIIRASFRQALDEHLRRSRAQIKP